MLFVRRFALGFGLFCGLVSSQLPEFAQQYRQRLGGAVDELTTIVDRFSADASNAGMDKAQAIAKLQSNADVLARGRGRDMTQTIERRDRLAAQQARFSKAGPVGRLIVFAENVDPDIARRAWSDYEPAVPTTTEGFATAGAGAIFGYAVARLLGLPIRRRRRRLAQA